MTDTLKFVRCDNCKKDILPSNFTIHEIHCQRNIYFCSKCNEPVNLKEKAEHEKANHIFIFCTKCHVQIEKFKLNDHITKDCPHRKVKCQICDIEVGAHDISEHENYCGSRTEKCLDCGEFVMLKYKQLHIESNHTFIKLSDEPGPSPSWQNGMRTLESFFPDLQSRNHSAPSCQKKKLMKKENSYFRVKGLPDLLAAEDKSAKCSFDQSKIKKLNSYQESIVGNNPKKQNFERLNTAEGAKKDSNFCIKPDSDSIIAEKYCRENEEASKNYDLMFKKSKQSSLTGKDSFTKIRDHSTNKSKANENKNIHCRQTNRPPNKHHFTEEDADFAFALQISNEINNINDAQLKKEEIIAQAIEENAAGLSEFSFTDTFEKNKITSGRSLPKKNIYCDKKSNKTISKSRVKYHADDSSDEESFLYSSSRDKTENVNLPCQFCGALYPPSNLMSHQKQCNIYGRIRLSEADKNFSSFYDSEKGGTILCEICLQFVPLNLFNFHQIKFHRKSFENSKEELFEDKRLK